MFAIGQDDNTQFADRIHVWYIIYQHLVDVYGKFR